MVSQKMYGFYWATLYISSVRHFPCSISEANRPKSFYRAFNAIFGKVGRVASVLVVIELIITKCLPILVYGLEVCPLNRPKAQMKSLNFVLKSCSRKLFGTKSTEIVDVCMQSFNCSPVSEIVVSHKSKFLTKFSK